MPLANLHLLHLSPALPLPTALHHLSTTTPPPLTLSIPLRWIISPSNIPSPSPLLTTPWTLLYITLSPSPLPSTIIENLLSHYHLQVGIPRALIQDFAAKNARLLHPSAEGVPKLASGGEGRRIAGSGQELELTASLLEWINDLDRHKHAGEGGWRGGAVSMLNFLAFKEGDGWREKYARYGKAFGGAEGPGGRRGGVAKLVGGVVAQEGGSNGAKEKGRGKGRGNSEEVKAEVREWSGEKRIGDGPSSTQQQQLQQRKWDEFALAHYPSLAHFADMLGSEDYQEINKKDRVPSLEDTCILFTSELLVEEILRGAGGGGGGGGKARL